MKATGAAGATRLGGEIRSITSVTMQKKDTGFNAGVLVGCGCQTVCLFHFDIFTDENELELVVRITIVIAL